MTSFINQGLRDDDNPFCRANNNDEEDIEMGRCMQHLQVGFSNKIVPKSKAVFINK